MTKTDLHAYRDLLIALRDRHNGDVSHLADEALRRTGSGATGNLSNMPIHMADIGSDNYEQEFSLSLMENEGAALAKIQTSLERIEDGTYGACEECGAKIPKTRLNAIPYANLCIKCASEQEQG